MLKRPAIKQRPGAAQTRVLSYHEEVAKQQAAAKEAYYKKLQQIKPSRFPWVKKFREKKAEFTISGLQTNLFNATGECASGGAAPIDIFNYIVEDPSEHPEIVTASLKGGRFKEMARYNRKGVVELKGGKPNQIGIKFVIDGKNNYVNIFDNGSVRWGGSSEEYKVFDFINDYTGKINYIVYSNHSGQMHVNQEINLKALADNIDLKWFEKGTRLKYEGAHVTLSLGDIKYERFEKEVFRARHQIKTAGLRPVEYNVKEIRTKSANIVFFKSGIVQYQGKYVNQDIIVDIVRGILTRLQHRGIFLGHKEAPKPKASKSTEYKTRSRNPPNPPNSFEGKCTPGYYCRPNAQGFPTCYIIPVINSSSRKTVVDSYKTAGAKIPKSVMEIFKIEKEPEPEKYEISMVMEKQTYKGKTINVLKIGGRQAMRMTEDQLEDVARKKHIPGITKGLGVAKMVAKLTAHIMKKDEPYINQKDQLRLGERLCTSWSKQQLLDLGYPGTHPEMTHEQICTRIEYYTRGLSATKHNFEFEGTKFSIEGDKILGAKRRNGKPNPGRKCATLPTEILYKYARAMGIDPSGKSKTQICKEMQEKKIASHTIRVAQVKAEAPKPEPTKLQKITSKFEELLGSKNYDKKQLKEWMLAEPYKRKILIKQWKREQNLERLLNSMEVGPFRNDLRRYAMEHTEDQTRAHAKRLLETRARLEKPSTFHGVELLETETM
jgi:hypothetical protein